MKLVVLGGGLSAISSTYFLQELRIALNGQFRNFEYWNTGSGDLGKPESC